MREGRLLLGFDVPANIPGPTEGLKIQGGVVIWWGVIFAHDLNRVDVTAKIWKNNCPPCFSGSNGSATCNREAIFHCSWDDLGMCSITFCSPDA